jgi:hypothetical protein
MPQIGSAGIVIVATIRLGSLSRRTDTQETEILVEQVEEHRADGYTADGSGIRQVTHYSHIH